MKNLMISALALIGVLCASCGSNAASNDPWAGQTLNTTLGEAPGFGDFADYTLGTQSMLGEDLTIHGYFNSVGDTMFFVTESGDDKVIASLAIPATDVKPTEGVLCTGVYEENFDASKGYDNIANPYYVIIRTIDTEYRMFSTDIVKAWRFDPKAGVFEEVPTEGLAYMAEGNDWV